VRVSISYTKFRTLFMTQLTEQQRAISENGSHRFLDKMSSTKRASLTELTTIHKSILRLLERGCTKQQAANILDMNVHTLDAHLREIYRIVDVHTMTAAVAKAIREKII